ncbi:MAG: TRAP transporter large permease, partial [Clostridiaceae bacterium]|nr:TRAP transporter large permease [Clostridiaceae bacterium]
ALPVLGILMGVGMFIQVMTLTGVRGFIVVNSLSLPPILLYLGIAITIPLFGAVSAYGASSVLGVPFLLALLDKDQIITASAISLIASLGDMMPPTALAGMFAAQIVGLEDYFKVLKKCIIPAIILIIYALLFIIFSKPLAALIS